MLLLGVGSAQQAEFRLVLAEHWVQRDCLTFENPLKPDL